MCGITNLDDALLAVKFGADALGFNFYEKSPRYIPAATAAAIKAQLRETVLTVGVFVNEAIDRICEVADIVGLNAVQLHADENIEFLDSLKGRLNVTTIKALRVGPDFRSSDIYDYNAVADAILLDGFSGTEFGGTGATFDWEIARQAGAFVSQLYLAGGLSPENIQEAMRTVQPYAVDVCSRIETEPGKKDAVRMKRFIDAVRDAE